MHQTLRLLCPAICFLALSLGMSVSALGYNPQSWSPAGECLMDVGMSTGLFGKLSKVGVTLHQENTNKTERFMLLLDLGANFQPPIGTLISKTVHVSATGTKTILFESQAWRHGRAEDNTVASLTDYSGSRWYKARPAPWKLELFKEGTRQDSELIATGIPKKAIK